MKKWAVFIDYCDAGQEVFKSYEDALAYYEELCIDLGNSSINVYLCEVLKTK